MAEELKVGDFVIVEGAYNFSVYEVESISCKLFKGKEPGWRAQRLQRSSIVYSGAKEQCDNLKNALNLIVSRYNMARTSWLKQHADARKAEIAAAIAKAVGG